MPVNWAILAMADADGAGAGALGAWLVTAIALALSLIGRWRLPLGVAEGLFVAALSGLLLLNFATWGQSAEATFLRGASLVSLAVVWFIVAVWVERETQLVPDEDAARRRAVRRTLAVYAAAVSGLLATAVLLSAYERGGILAPGLILLMIPLLAMASGLYFWRRGVLSRYGMIGVLVLLLWLAVPREAVETHRIALARGLLFAGLVILAVVVATVLYDWRRRVRIWPTEYEFLVEPPPRYGRFFGLLVAVGVLTGLGGVLLADAGWMPLAVLLAAFAVFVVGHRWRSNALGELGLALLAESLITAGLAWLPASRAWELVGWAVAGVYLAWLARFWHQQLNRGQPWTTAGRLIPAARHLSYAAVGGQVVVAAMWTLGNPDTSGRWAMLLAALCMLAHWSLLARDAAAQQATAAGLASGLVLVATLVPIGQVAAALGLELRPGVLLAAAGLILALRVGAAQRGTSLAWVWNAYVGGLIPVAVAYDLALGGWATGYAGAIVAVVLAGLAVGIRWRHGLLTARGVL
jgi:hypothetical protein